MRRQLNIQVLLLAVVVIATSSGCQLFPGRRQQPVAPIAFHGTPSQEQVIAQVNANSNRVQQLQAAEARLNVSGIIVPLTADVSYDGPHRFRLIARTGVTGKELDMGSNDEQFWFWAKRNEPKVTYIARRDQYNQSAARKILPVQPEWLIDAMGVVRFSPTDRHEGPFPRRDGKLEMRSFIASPDGNLTRVAIIDGQYGWVTEQHIYGPDSKLLVSSVMSRHKRDEMTGVILPHKVSVRMPTLQQQLAFTLEVNQYRVNDNSGDPSMLWAVPNKPDYPLVDLADPRLASPYVQYERAASAVSPISTTPMTRVGSRPRHYGETQRF